MPISSKLSANPMKPRRVPITSITLIVLLVIFVTSLTSNSETLEEFGQAKPHPLPSSLQQWEAKSEVGDYFSEVEESPFGYLVWSDFPVKVYLDLSASSSQQKKAEWEQAVTAAMEEWSQYLPLTRVSDRAQAQIIIARSRPPLNTKRDSETGGLTFDRARTARTRYEFDLDREESRLVHSMLVEITPDQRQELTLATARHEIGHALGIWGHSPHQKDALYYSHVRDSPEISPRDVNTLKKIYQQPTHLGWKIGN